MTALPLLDLQQRFQRHLLDGDADVAEAVRDGGIGAARRLAIYHHAYRWRLVEALRDTYGHTLRHLGGERFDAAALAHVEVHPSAHPSLRDYGDGFDATLAATHPDAGALPELARLDLALRRAFDGPDAPVLTLEALATLDAGRWADAAFELHPTAVRSSVRFNTLQIWQALDDDLDPPPPQPLAEAGEVLVWRRGHRPHFRSLAPFEAAALDAVQSGASFAATAQRLVERFGAAGLADALGGLLRRWIDEELLSRLRA
jgi:hypothetical protein